MRQSVNQSRRIRSTLAIAAAAATSTMIHRAAMAQFVPYSGGTYVQTFSGLTNQDQQQWLQANGQQSAPVAPIWTDNATLPGWFSYSPGLSAVSSGIYNKQVQYVGDGTPKAFTTWNQFGTPFVPATNDKTTYTGGLYDLGQTVSGAYSTSAVGGTVRAIGATSTGTSGLTTFGVELKNTTANTTYNSINISALAEEWFSGANPSGGGINFKYGILTNSATNPISDTNNFNAYQSDTNLSFVNTAGGNAPVPGGLISSTLGIYGNAPYNGQVPINSSPFNQGERAGVKLDPVANSADSKALTDNLPVLWGPGQTLFIGWQAQSVSGGALMGIGNLQVSGVALNANAKYLTWSGAASSNWNTTDVDWTDNKNANAPTTFSNTNMDITYFGNTGVGSIAVQGAGVSPSAIYVQNTSGTYTFTGGSIGTAAGGGTLQKSGAGTLNLSPSSTNGFQGLQIEGGTVIAATDGALGDPSGGITLDSNFTGAKDGLGNAIPAAPAVFQSAGLITSARNWTINAGGGTINIPAAADNMTIGGNFQNTGAFVKSGAGTLTITGQISTNQAATFSIAAGAVVMQQNTTTYEPIIAPAAPGGFVGDLYVNGPFRMGIFGGSVSGGGHVYVEANNTGIYVDTPVGGAPGTTTTLTNPVILNSNNLPNTAQNPYTAFLGASGAGNFLIINGSGVSGNANVVFTNSLQTGGGAGEIDLNVANTWTGSTTFDESGPVVMGAANGIPSGTSVTFGNGHGGGIGTFDLNGFSINISSLGTQLDNGSNGGVPLTASNAGNISNAGAGMSTINIHGSAATTYQGVIGAGTYVNSSGTQGTNNIALNLQAGNTGTLTLTGQNTYTGGTTISGGSLVINTFQYTNNLTPPTTTYGSSLPANSNVTNNSPAAYGLVINDGPTSVTPPPANPSTGTTANQITGSGNTEINPTGLLKVGTLNQGTVANAGTLTINTAGTITHGINNSNGTSTQGSTTIAAAATVNSGNVIQNSLTVNGTLHIIPGPGPQTPASTSVVNSLTLAGPANGPWTGKLDVGNSAFVVQAANAAAAATAEATIYAQLQQGAHDSGSNPTWNGTGGIVSSLLAGGSTSNTVGEALNTFGYTTFGGKPVNANSILVGYTLSGDVNMDGTVDANDINVILGNFGNFGPGVTYGTGDANYDNTVDANDLNLVLNNFGNFQSAVSVYTSDHLSSDGIALEGNHFVVVPEPTSLGLLAFSGLLLARRRRIV